MVQKYDGLFAEEVHDKCCNEIVSPRKNLNIFVIVYVKKIENTVLNKFMRS